MSFYNARTSSESSLNDPYFFESFMKYVNYCHSDNTFRLNSVVMVTT